MAQFVDTGTVVLTVESDQPKVKRTKTFQDFNCFRAEADFGDDDAGKFHPQFMGYICELKDDKFIIRHDGFTELFVNSGALEVDLPFKMEGHVFVGCCPESRIPSKVVSFRLPSHVAKYKEGALFDSYSFGRWGILGKRSGSSLHRGPASADSTACRCPSHCQKHPLESRNWAFLGRQLGNGPEWVSYFP